MKSVLIFVSILYILIEATAPTDYIEPIEQRIRVLKHQIIDELKGNQGAHDSEVYKDIYDYVDDSKIPVTLKNEPELFKQLELKSTTTAGLQKLAASPEKVDKVGPLRIRKHKKKKAKRTSAKKKNVEIFYRRTIFDGNARDKPQKWTHCLDLLSPFLNGFLSNVTECKKVESTDILIRRLSYLLGLNMTDASNDEIRAILYEISTLQVRIFQWDIAAIRTIMNVIIQDFRHDFKGLKYGIKALFANWKLNTSNLTRVLTQSRIFRPPCIQVSNYGGSTVTPRHDHSRYTRKPTTPRCNRRNDDDDECLDY